MELFLACRLHMPEFEKGRTEEEIDPGSDYVRGDDIIQVADKKRA